MVNIPTIELVMTGEMVLIAIPTLQKLAGNRDFHWMAMMSSTENLWRSQLEMCSVSVDQGIIHRKLIIFHRQNHCFLSMFPSTNPIMTVIVLLFTAYSLVKQHNYGKSTFLMRKLHINGHKRVHCQSL